MSKTFPPGPQGHFLLGNYTEFRANMADFLRTLPSYGDIASFRVGPLRFYVLFHPEHVHQVLVGDADKFYKDNILKTVFKPFAGNSVILVDGGEHRRQRQLMQPAFHYKRLEGYGRAMVDGTVQAIDRWQPTTELELHHEMMNITLDIVAKTLFNIEVKNDASNVQEVMGTLQELLGAQLQQAIPLPEWLPTPQQRKKKAAISAFHAIIKRMIADHRASGEDKGDLLSMLMLAKDETDGSMFTDEELVHETVTLFVAGYEATAATLFWAWYILAQHPEVEEKLQQELGQVLNGRLPAMKDIPDLKYTTAFIKETLRLYPSLWFMNRQTIADVKIGDYTLPKGALVTLAPFITQVDPRFFERPASFMPERFMGEAEKQIPRFAYFPFGGGPRICIGQQFALMNATLIMATIAQRYKLNLVPNQTVEEAYLISIRPKHDVRMIPTVREAQKVSAVTD